MPPTFHRARDLASRTALRRAVASGACVTCWELIGNHRGDCGRYGRGRRRVVGGRAGLAPMTAHPRRADCFHLDIHLDIHLGSRFEVGRHRAGARLVGCSRMAGWTLHPASNHLLSASQAGHGRGDCHTGLGGCRNGGGCHGRRGRRGCRGCRGCRGRLCGCLCGRR